MRACRSKVARQRALLLAVGMMSAGLTWAGDKPRNAGLVEQNHEAQAEHVDQGFLLNLILSGEATAAFEHAFETGDELFDTRFNALDGVGANVGDGTRFTRVPRADLRGPGQWANHVPPRVTGPNGQACNECHAVPFGTSAGNASLNVHRDPTRSGRLRDFIRRDVTSLFGSGALQRLAEEMTAELHAQRDAAAERACRTGNRQRVRLTSKNVSFGKLTAVRVGAKRRARKGKGPCVVKYKTAGVKGVDEDLVVKPFQWKGIEPTVRAFNRDASHNELGMQPVELVGAGVDADADGVTDEFTIGDQTALAVYVAGQPRPTTRVELAQVGLIAPLDDAELQAIATGRARFSDVGCAACHKPELTLNDPVFSEPSLNSSYRDEIFPAGQDPTALGVDPEFPVAFNLTSDLPDNIIEDDNGEVISRLANFESNDNGGATIRLFGDLKRHDMGKGLRENVDDGGVGASVWLTAELWGVGSTAPYLHDGRATTLTEAIVAHGGEARRSRRQFAHLSRNDQAALIAFLENLVLLKIEEEGEDE